MPMAALPKYLGDDFSEASPGLRFGMYLPVWGKDNKTGETLWTSHDLNYREAGRDRQVRQFKDENKTQALNQSARLNANDQQLMEKLAQRQAAAASVLPQMLSLQARSIAPFTTGLGNEHPLENGFAFLNPYGLPYLPGSGVKGVLRQAARELASGDWGDERGWSQAPSYALKMGKEPVHFSMIDALFGKECSKGGKEQMRGALSFWDVIPQIKGDRLEVEVMTAHQSHYYQKKRDDRAGNSDSPHESGQPNPINFLSVPPGSGFAFHVQCHQALLARIAPDLAEADRWQGLLQAAFEHAFDWLGFGAKTAVGYGSLQRDAQAEAAMKQAFEQIQAQAQAQAELDKLSDEQRQIKELEQLFLATKDKGGLDAGCPVATQRLKLLDDALGWESPEYRQQAADLLRRIAKDLPWAKKRKQEASDKLARLMA
ncbi:MAG: type III-B CRISPR module RAMP protein Cmr6 [Gammaproteobacteria bacterium SHHR-1]